MLTIVGMGIRGLEQVTLEGMRAIKRARRVLHLTAREAALEQFLADLGVDNVGSLEHLYSRGAVDDDNYRAVVAEVLGEVHQWQEVALLLYGHPRLGVTLTAQLEQALLPDVDVVPAPSSFDTMINDLRRDPLEKGSMLMDANRMLLLGLRPDVHMDLFVFHVDAVATRKTKGAEDNGSRWQLLRDYLLRFYDPMQLVSLISSGAAQCEQALVANVELSNLGDAAHAMRFGATLFVPGRKPSSVNRDVYELLVASAEVP